MGDEPRVWTAPAVHKPVDLVRDVLAYETGRAAASIRLDTTCRWCGDPRHGKPRAESAPPFSFAYSAGLALVAVGPPELGVDVERHTGGAVLEGSAIALAAEEAAAVAAADDPAAAFLALWTRKEAYLKGTGRGLVEDPAAVTFRAAGEGWEEPLLVGRPTGWLVRSLALPAGFTGALAVEGPQRPVRLVAWPPAA